MPSILSDAFAHHAWANDRILEACEPLTPEQLATPTVGTFGPILDTLRHLIGSDNWYLWVITEGRHEEFPEETRRDRGAQGRRQAVGRGVGSAPRR